MLEDRIQINNAGWPNVPKQAARSHPSGACSISRLLAQTFSKIANPSLTVPRTLNGPIADTRLRNTCSCSGLARHPVTVNGHTSVRRHSGFGKDRSISIVADTDSQISGLEGWKPDKTTLRYVRAAWAQIRVLRTDVCRVREKGEPASEAK